MTAQILLNGITIEQLAEALKPLLQKPLAEPQHVTNELIGRKEACALLHCNLSTLHKHTKSGRLKSYGIGNRVLYKKSEVLESVTPINH
ncbi:DNA-binding protein [Flavobacterium aquariorum]|uniref:DNA-binding protein n=1 Tax=Flavobacterium aquariorum TaxID=2217670 RepID=A0A2W7TQH6_9FLAO|nr:helix-turn-helix domain-containing protein [Flavobacterium aquariorum]PZX92783.1 DNA-binding protein [Flavobacterium aquariorum]